MGLSFHVEWLDAPGVADVVDAALWARLEVVAEGVDGTAVPLTELRDARTGQVRSGVYGSLYPLARWVVDACWNLLWEIRRTPRLQSGRNAARIEALRPWVQRHCLLAAREGFSLPDLTLARDGEHVVLALFPDPPAGSVSARRPVSFIGRATLRLRREAVEEALRTFVDAVLERLRGVEHPDAQRLRDDWSAIFDADEAEARLCAWAARLGIDPYDEEQLDERLVEFIEDHLVGLPAGLRTDLLDAASGATELEQAVSWLARHDSVLHGLPEPGPIGPREAAGSAHQVGYARARRLRRELRIGTSADNIVGAVGSAYGFDFSSERPPDAAVPEPLEALVGAHGAAVPLLVGGELPYPARAFRWARALYLWRFGMLRQGPRLLTRSHERLQREGRAFAAELLAPAAALKKRIRRPSLGEHELMELADEFQVSPLLIQHQVENHGLAEVE